MSKNREINAIEEDRFDLENHVKEFYEQYIDSDYTGTVLLSGNWGVGKSSYINLVENYSIKNKEIKFIRLNFWSFSGEQTIYRYIFTNLYPRINIILNWLAPIVVALFFLLNNIINLMFSNPVNWNLLAPLLILTSIVTVFQDKAIKEGWYESSVTKKFKTKRKKLIIIVDDFDRIPSNIREDIYIKNREVREEKLREQVKKDNEKIDRKNISNAEKKNLKSVNNKRLNDKLAADSQKMLKVEKKAKKAINRDIAKKVPVKMANKAGKDAVKAMFVAALFGMLKEIMNALVRFFKSKKRSFDIFLSEMKNALHSFFDKIKDFIKLGVDSFVGSIVGEIIGVINQKLKKLPNLIKQIFGSIRESISYLSNSENQSQSTAIKIAHISKIITSGLVAVGAMFLGEYFEKYLLAIPGMKFEIPLLGSIANILGIFFASLLTGILGAIIINGLDGFISRKLQDENKKQQADKKKELLRIQDVQIFVAEQNVAVKRNDIFSKMAKNHQKLRELLGNVQEEFFDSRVASEQRLLVNEIYFDEKQSELEEMQNALNDLL